MKNMDNVNKVGWWVILIALLMLLLKLFGYGLDLEIAKIALS